MKYKFLLIPLFLTVSVGAPAAEYRSTIGVGLHYAGLGWQPAFIYGPHKIRAALGTGISVGYDYRIHKKISVGLQAFVASFIFEGVSGGGVNINYHLKETYKGGWVIGLDLSSTEKHGINLYEENIPKKQRASVSIGYGF